MRLELIPPGLGLGNLLFAKPRQHALIRGLQCCQQLGQFLLAFQQVIGFQLQQQIAFPDALPFHDEHLGDPAADARAEPNFVGFDHA